MNIPKSIAEAITAVMQEVQYVQKKGTNQFHNYKFAAIGDILEKLQPAMAKAGLSVAQNQVTMSFYNNGAVLAIEYEFILSHISGETWGICPRHTGMASCTNSKGGFDDKAANKCHTAARKYFLIGLFQIPTGDHADPDAEEDKPANNKPLPQKTQPAVSRTKAWVDSVIEKLSAGDIAFTDWEIANVKQMAALQKTDAEQHQRLIDFLTNGTKEAA